MTIETLYPLVTEAIMRADTLEDLGAPGAAQAHVDVSLLEEKIAGLLPASDPEGAMARRGAVRAAAKADDHRRAQALADRFFTEDDVSDELREQITRILADSEDTIAARNPRAAARYGVDEIRRVARALARQGAPFPIC